MLEDHFAEELQRIVDVFDELPLAHVKELKRAYLKVDRRLWAQMVNHVIDHSQYIPRPSKFWMAYEVLKGAWRTEGDDGQHLLEGCELCSHGFRQVYLVVNGQPYSSLDPCTCNPVKLNQAAHHAKIERYISLDQYEAMVVQNQARVVVRERPARLPVQEEAPPAPAKEPKPGPQPIADSLPQLPEDLTW